MFPLRSEAVHVQAGADGCGPDARRQLRRNGGAPPTRCRDPADDKKPQLSKMDVRTLRVQGENTEEGPGQGA